MRIIYCLMDPDSGEIRYVGKTSVGLKRIDQHLKSARKSNPKTRVQRWISRVVSEGKIPRVAILDYAESDDELCRLEIMWITNCRDCGCNLTNMSDGGDGNRGFKHSEETKRKLAEISRNLPAVVRAKQSVAQRAAPFSEKRSKSVSAALVGKKLSQEHCENISRGKKGKKTGWSFWSGKKLSDETRKKLSESVKASWSRRKSGV
jgi:hypothetical protein